MATVFSIKLADLSGAINVLLFLIFPRPEELSELDVEIAPQNSSSAAFSDVAKFQHSLEPTSVAQPVDEGSRNGAVQSRVSSRRISDDDI